ncbi:MAG: methylated-DNA--[protein]-cysteine S-methyltransferase [Dehalococcoidales bacterium]|nr:methylated-DNA--[protein]-cysteine S-methyltransferase [Dehalococcoidales bacterium]
MGWVGILGSPDGIRRTTLPQASAEAAYQRLGKEAASAEPSPRLFASLTARLKRYFQGERVGFPDELDLAGVAPFQVRVWQAARLIPYGETRSYRWLAGQAGNPKAARAVGTALARNPLPIIVPCHRVVASNGGLGGFSGGLETKRRLLSLEVQVNTGKI